MTIIGTNFTEIGVKKNKPIVKGMKINNNLGIKSVEKMDLSLGQGKQAGVKFIFEYVTKYEPDVADMKLEGEVLILESKDKVDEILKNWKAKKPIDEAIMTNVMNSALTKSTIKALIFAQDMGLPSPVKLPRIVQKQK